MSVSNSGANSPFSVIGGGGGISYCYSIALVDGSIGAVGTSTGSEAYAAIELS